MDPEIRVLIERAQARRVSLDAFLDVLPGTMLDRIAEGDRWTAANHLEHLATVDELVAELVADATRGMSTLWLGGSDRPGRLEDRRLAAMSAVAGTPMPGLRELMHSQRQGLLAHIAGLQPGSLDATVLIAGAVDRWGTPVAWTVRAYLAGWVEHDPEHEAAIRRAITTPPSPGLVAAVRPGRQGPR